MLPKDKAPLREQYPLGAWLPSLKRMRPLGRILGVQPEMTHVGMRHGKAAGCVYNSKKLPAVALPLGTVIYFKFCSKIT